MERWTNKRRAFLEHYFQCNMNATEAARRAGYKHPNVKGSQLVKVSLIRAAIDARLAEMAIPANEVLARLGDQGRASIADFVTAQGDVDWSAVQARGHLIKRIIKRADGGVTIELHDAQAALIHLDRHHGGQDGSPLPEVVEVNVREELTRRLARIAARERESGDAGRSDG